MKFYQLLFFFILFFNQKNVCANDIKIAVASNFKNTMNALVKDFKNQSNDIKIILISASTGKHYAQIRNGAPFDIFFAADIERPKLLEQDKIALPKSRVTYALGRLALWSSQEKNINPQENILIKGQFHHIAMANPKLAPYGRAALEVLKSQKLLKPLRKKIVYGENITQTFQFVNSKNAEFGFVSYSQIISYPKGSWWIIPSHLYSPIQQQLVLLSEKRIAKKFVQFVLSEKGKNIIKNHGYNVP